MLKLKTGKEKKFNETEALNEISVSE